MKCIISFCSEGVVKDSRSNNITAYNILERFSSAGFPLFIQKMFFFSLLEKEEGDEDNGNLQLSIKNNEEQLTNISVDYNFSNGKRTRQIVQIAGLPIPSPGCLNFILKGSDNDICEYSIEIVKKGEVSADQID